MSQDISKKPCHHMVRQQPKGQHGDAPKGHISRCEAMAERKLPKRNMPAPEAKKMQKWHEAILAAYWSWSMWPTSPQTATPRTKVSRAMWRVRSVPLLIPASML